MSKLFKPGKLYLAVMSYDLEMEKMVRLEHPMFSKLGVAYYQNWGPMIHKDCINGSSYAGKLLYGSPFMVLDMLDPLNVCYNIMIVQASNNFEPTIGYIKLFDFCSPSQSDAYPIEIFSMKEEK